MSSDTTLVGNVTRDPELKYTSSGSALLNFGIAVNRRWQSNGEWQEETSFFDVVAWSDLAENIGATVSKGDRVIVVGRLQQRTWENDEGEKRSKVEVVAEDVGPSLRWATAEITKNERNDDDRSSRSGNRSRGEDRSASRQSRDRDSGGSGGRRPRQRADEPNYDEEPF